MNSLPVSLRRKATLVVMSALLMPALRYFINHGQVTNLGLHTYTIRLLFVLPIPRMSSVRRAVAFVNLLPSSKNDSNSLKTPSSFTPKKFNTVDSLLLLNASLFVTSSLVALPSAGMSNQQVFDPVSDSGYY